MEHNEIMQALADYYPLRDLLEQNDIEPIVVIRFLVDEGFLDPNDYVYDEVEDEENDC